MARNGKAEVRTCIAGLEQYSFAYEEAFEQAKWMQQVYSNSVMTPHQIAHPLMRTSSPLPNGIQNEGDLTHSPLMLFIGNGNNSSNINMAQVFSPHVSSNKRLTSIQTPGYTDSPNSAVVDNQAPYVVGYSH